MSAVPFMALRMLSGVYLLSKHKLLCRYSSVKRKSKEKTNPERFKTVSIPRVSVGQNFPKPGNECDPWPRAHEMSLSLSRTSVESASRERPAFGSRRPPRCQRLRRHPTSALRGPYPSPYFSWEKIKGPLRRRGDCD